MRKPLALAALALLFAAPAFAEEPEHPALRLASRAYYVSVAADDLSTAWSLREGNIETDPVARAIVGNGSPARLALGAALDIALTVLVTKTVAKSHPRLATGLFWVASSVRIGVSLSNVAGAMNAREAKRR